MNIVEDKEDRERVFARLTREQFTIRAKAFEPAPRSGWPRQHQLWPCVRQGAGERYLLDHGWNPGGSKRRALNFVRGHAHEAILAEAQSLTVVYQDVACNVDDWTGDPAAPFAEIKSTMASSARMWEIVQRGSIKLLEPFETSYFRGYFEQMLNYAVAFGVDRGRLRIFFMHGEYAERRKACPSCGGALGDVVDVYRPCGGCGYKSYIVDLRSYILTFWEDEIMWIRKEVFEKRRDQFNFAIQGETMGQLLMRAEPTHCYVCHLCGVGREIGCEHASKQGT